MRIKHLLYILMSLTGMISCKKEYLEIKSNKALVVPGTIEDFQALLDNDNIMNSGSPALGELGCDDYFIPNNIWQSLSEFERDCYTWNGSLSYISNSDWNNPYRQIYYANVVLNGISEISPTTNQIGWNNVKGSALFYRANAFYNIAQIFAEEYNDLTADTEPGIILKLSSDIEEAYSRSTVRQTYQQILDDLQSAIPLLPLSAIQKTRPSKVSVYALLARVYLNMSDYDNALKYADSALSLYNTLIDFNTLNTSASLPFSRFNSEVIFHHTMILYITFLSSRRTVDTTLYQLYESDDLRRQAYFRTNANGFAFKGSYTGSGSANFSGLTTDELYLIRAECNARKGNVTSAMNDLNALLITRWKTGTFVPLIAANAEKALQIILLERRKELCFRGIRWPDLKRLNNDPLLAKSLIRNLDMQSYSLPPGDPRYIWPIPENEIEISGVTQNPR